MTLEQIENTLPNGLHDALIRGFDMDYGEMRLRLRVDLLVGLPSQPFPDRERYQPGEICFHGVQVFAVEFPQAESPFQQLGAICFSYKRSAPDMLPTALIREFLPNTDLYTLFINDWLSSIHIAALDVSVSLSELMPE